MHQAVCGDSSFATNSSSEAAPVAPSRDQLLRPRPVRIEDDRGVPARSSRRTMFAPIRPSPIMPICIESPC